MAYWWENPNTNIDTEEGYKNAAKAQGLDVDNPARRIAKRLQVGDYQRQLSRQKFLGGVAEPAYQGGLMQGINATSTDSRVGKARRQGGSILDNIRQRAEVQSRGLRRAGFDQKSILGMENQAMQRGYEQADALEAQALSPEAQMQGILQLLQLTGGALSQDQVGQANNNASAMQQIMAQRAQTKAAGKADDFGWGDALGLGAQLYGMGAFGMPSGGGGGGGFTGNSPSGWGGIPYL